MATSFTGGFDSSEHSYIGKIIQMDELKVLTLPNDVEIEFGQIIALAGDFYGFPKQPIIDPSKGQNEEDSDRQQRFIDAYNTLASAPKDKLMEELNKLLATLEKESQNDETIDAKTWDEITGGKWLGTLPIKKGRMLQLAENNSDHFLPYAKDAYLTGHQLAIEKAREAGRFCRSDKDKRKRLHEAFSLEAFACHFLTDSFASGHIRTPRVELGNGTISTEIGNWLCKYMHDEDNKYGLRVTNKSGNEWIAYGDGRLLDEESRDNLKIVADTVQKSVHQVYDAYTNPRKTLDYAVVTDLIPFVDQHKENNSPLFQVKDGELHRRSDISDLKDEKTVTNWWGLTTALILWDYEPGNSAI